MKLSNGLHKDKPWDQIPTGYLKWLVSVEHGLAKYASEELERRRLLIASGGVWREPKA
jgi:hypothetical protein